MSQSSAILLGSKQFGLSAFKALKAASGDVEWQVLHPNDSSDSRSVANEFGTFCDAEDVPFALVSPREANERIGVARPDVVFVCGWYALIPPELLALETQFLGIHNSMLPKYRGGAPLVWALINGDTTVGSSLFEIGKGMDDGQILDAIKLDIGMDEDIGQVSDRIELAWLKRLPSFWVEFLAGNIEGRVQDDETATYSAQRRPEDGKIDWRWPARRVHNFIRAQSRPYPGAFTHGPDGKITIWRSRVFPETAYGTPGQPIMRIDEGIVVACGDGTALVIDKAENEQGETGLAAIIPALSLRL